MSGAAVRERMALVGVPLIAGRATGPIEPIDDADAANWRRGPPGRVIVAVGTRWPPPEAKSPEVVAAVFERTPARSATGGPFPIVGRLERDLFAAGDRVTVDGDRGEVEIAGVTETPVVTAFLERDDGRILLLRRSAKVGSFQGRWASVSGYLEDPTPEGQAIREVHEETGLTVGAPELRSVGRSVYARDGTRVWVVHPFRFRVGHADVSIDWEHTEFEWVEPSEIGRRPTVPKLDRAWAMVAPTSDERQKG